jgi:hypothetical protein
LGSEWWSSSPSGRKGVGKDIKEAYKLDRKAVEQNNPLDNIFLGNCYQEGKGVRKNGSEACSLLSQQRVESNEPLQIHFSLLLYPLDNNCQDNIVQSIALINCLSIHFVSFFNIFTASFSS